MVVWFRKFIYFLNSIWPHLHSVYKCSLSYLIPHLHSLTAWGIGDCSRQTGDLNLICCSVHNLKKKKELCFLHLFFIVFIWVLVNFSAERCVLSVKFGLYIFCQLWFHFGIWDCGLVVGVFDLKCRSFDCLECRSLTNGYKWRSTSHPKTTSKPLSFKKCQVLSGNISGQVALFLFSTF